MWLKKQRVHVPGLDMQRVNHNRMASNSRMLHSSDYRQVTLVSNKHNRHVWISMLPGIFQPTCQVIERFSPGVNHIHVEH